MATDRIHLTLYVLLFLTCAMNAQTIIVKPYLQDASPVSIKILWKTDGGAAGQVDWGTDAANLNQSEPASMDPRLLQHPHHRPELQR
jgi:hypothetical protein